MKLPFIFEKRQDSSEQESDLREHPDTETEQQNGSEEKAIRGLSDLYQPKKADKSHVRDIVDVLVDMGKLTAKQSVQLRQQQSEQPDSDVETLLLKTGLVNADDILESRAKLCGLEFRHIEPEAVERKAFEKLDIDFIKNNGVCPIAIEEGKLVVATCEPSNIFAIEDVKRQTKMKLQVVMCNTEDIEAVCNSFKAEGYDTTSMISSVTWKRWSLFRNRKVILKISRRWRVNRLLSNLLII